MTPDAIVQAGLRILDAEGLDKLTTIRLAQTLGVTQPALYSHFDSLLAIKQAIAAYGAAELSGRVRAALQRGSSRAARDDRLLAMAEAYRAYVAAHPDRYLLQLSAQTSELHVAAMEDAAEAVRNVLRTYDLSEADVRHAHTAFRAAVHGFVHLEVNGALGGSRGAVTAEFRYFVGLFAAGLRARAKSSPASPGRSPSSPR